MDLASMLINVYVINNIRALSLPRNPSLPKALPYTQNYYRRLAALLLKLAHAMGRALHIESRSFVGRPVPSKDNTRIPAGWLWKSYRVIEYLSLDGVPAGNARFITKGSVFHSLVSV